MQSKTTISPAKKALLIGLICSVSYLAVYIAKNTLSAVAPQITGAGAFSVEQIGTLSAVFFVAYAIGQLINGAVGDRIKGKYMISFGLVLASVGFWLLPSLAGRALTATAFYSVSAFFMAMIYGPMTKIVAENAEPHYAPRCSVGYTLASYLGSPAAGIIAASLSWQLTFCAAGGILVAMGILCFVVFTLFERRGLIRYGQYQSAAKKPAGDIRLLLRRKIVRFSLVAMLTGVVRTTVVFWLPTYMTGHLGFAPDRAAVLFSVATLAVASSAFIAVFVYERLGRNIERTVLLAFSGSAVCFLALFFVRQPAVNLVCVVLAILFNNCAATMLWSCYCPGLYDTGMVSGVTGFLDFCSYMAASAASAIFANSVSVIGWSGLILIWFALMFCGVLVALPWKRI